MSTRQVILDTETTGLEPALGHRIIEIGAVEMVNRRLTGNRFHQYLNPGREIDPGAIEVHGITNEMLTDKPKFADIVKDLLEFIKGAELIIHNADFDVEFLDMELGMLKLGRLSEHVAGITDTLAYARELHPGKRNSLDALCERYQIDHSHRTLHGALLDARLLAEVYLAMTRGQESLVMELETPAAVTAAAARVDLSRLLVVRPSAGELAAHEQTLDAIDKAAEGGSLWRRLAIPR